MYCIAIDDKNICLNCANKMAIASRKPFDFWLSNPLIERDYKLYCSKCESILGNKKSLARLKQTTDLLKKLVGS